MEKVSPVSGETIHQFGKSISFIMKHEQLIIFNAQGLVNYIPSNELYDTINGTNPGIEIMNSQLDYMKELKPTWFRIRRIRHIEITRRY